MFGTVTTTGPLGVCRELAMTIADRGPDGMAAATNDSGPSTAGPERPRARACGIRIGSCSTGSAVRRAIWSDMPSTVTLERFQVRMVTSPLRMLTRTIGASTLSMVVLSADAAVAHESQLSIAAMYASARPRPRRDPDDAILLGLVARIRSRVMARPTMYGRWSRHPGVGVQAAEARIRDT
ncbi:MAG: hypothetical protein NVS4B5_04700 [Vulcanimicrobiaceae bacterium]